MHTILKYILLVTSIFFLTNCGGSKTPPPAETPIVIDDNSSEEETNTTVEEPNKPLPNQAPEVNAGVAKSLFNKESLLLKGIASDSDGQIVSYRWSEGVSTLAHTQAFTYHATEVGTHTFTFCAEDNQSATTCDTVNITVKALRNPIAFFCWNGIENYTQGVVQLRGYEKPTLYLNPVDNGSADAFVENVENLQATGSKVWYLMSGTPDNDYLSDQVDLIANYNENHSKAIVGMVIDIEPWASFDEQNSSDNKDAWQTYLDMLTYTKDKLHAKGLSISASIPFWLDKVTEAFPNDRPINYDILDIVDEVVVMDYTVYEDRFENYADNTLTYAQDHNKQVILALEMQEIGNNKVSFATHPNDMKPFLEKTFSQYSAFKGFAIHSLDDFVDSGLDLSR